MMDVSDTVLTTEIRDRVMRLTITREARRNAMNAEVQHGISAALTRAVEGGDVGVVVLTGAGDRAFCSGADLAPDSVAFRQDFSRIGTPFTNLLRQVRDLPLPLVGRINGHCMAGGMGLMAMCDMVVAADHARFGLPEVKIGVFPMVVTSVLRALMPERAFAELALTGEPITAAEAHRLGLVNHVAPGAELDAKVDWLVGRLLDKSPTAIRRGKYALRKTEAMNFDEALAFLETQIGVLALTEDAREGRAAFNEKRRPAWTGR